METPGVRSGRDTISVLAVGDIMLVAGMSPLFKRYGAEYPFQRIQPLLTGADLLLGNLEAPFTSRNTPTPYKSPASVRARRDYILRADPRWAKALAFAGFDAVGLANNHMMDYQSGGLYDTLHTLDQLGIAYAGAGRNLAEARRPALVERKGMRCALLSYSCILPVGSVATSTRAGIAPARGEGAEEMIRADLSSAQREADFVIVSIHWGKQLAPYPDRSQRRLAHLMIEWGADAVIGHHPHVLQGIEVYGGRVIAYSLGDFVNLSSRPETLVLQLAVVRPHETYSVNALPLRLQRGRLHYANRRAWASTLTRLRHLSNGWGTRVCPFGSIALR